MTSEYTGALRMGQDLGYLGGTVIKVIGLCQHFQKKPRHDLVTAKLAVITKAAENWKAQRQPKLAPCPSNSVIRCQALNLQLVRLAILAKALKRRDSRWLKILFPQISNPQAPR